MAGKTMQAVVEIAGNLSPTLASSIEGATKKLDGINVKALAIGAAVGGIAIATSKAVIDAGKALYSLGSDFKDVENTIRIGTGATGDALEALVGDFESVYSSVPTNMEDAGKAIADYNTRLGLTGDELQSLSVQAIQVANMLGDDLGSVIEESSQAFQVWNISAEDMGDAMDYVFKASQSTGVGFNSLMGDVQRFAPQLQELGYSFEESVALIGQLDKAGVNASEVLGAMKKSVGALAKEGIGAAEGMELYADKIKNAKDMTEATTIASEIFGARAGSTMAAAIRDGTLSVADLTAELQANAETIAGCAEETYTLEQRMQMFKQKAEVALAPLAGSILDMVTDLMPVVSELMEGIIPVIQEMSAALIPIIKDIVPAIMPALQQLVPVILEIASGLLTQLIPPIVEIMASIIPVIIDLLNMLAPILNTIISSIMPIIVQLIQKLLPPLMKIISAVLPVLQKLLDAILPLLDELLAAILPIIIDLIDMLLPLVMQIIDAILPVLIKLLDTVMPILTELLSAILPIIIDLIGALLPIVTQIIEAILPVLITLLDLLTPILDLVIALLKPILDLFIMILEPILTLISAAIGPLIEIVTTLINVALKPLGPIIEFLAGLFSGYLGAAIEGLTPIIDAIIGVFSGLIDFVKNVFTGNWQGAWDAIVGIFGSIWDGIVAIFKFPINMIIKGINAFLGALNKIKIPDWVPGVGGKGINIPLIPELAAGGFTEGLSIAGEAGVEAVISFDPAYRAANVKYWEEAGQLLGVYNKEVTNETVTEAVATLPAYGAGGFTEGISVAGENGVEAVISFDPAYREANIRYWEAAGKRLGAYKGTSYIDESTQLAAASYSSIAETYTGDHYTSQLDAVTNYYKGRTSDNADSITVVTNPALIMQAIAERSLAQLDGESMSVLKSLPRYQYGGFTEGLSIAGETGTEAVISFDSGHREENIGYWAAAGKLLGIDDFSLSEMSEGQTIIYYDFSGLTWSPQFGGAEPEDDDFMTKLKSHEAEFFDWLEDFVKMREVGRFCSV